MTTTVINKPTDWWTCLRVLGNSTEIAVTAITAAKFPRWVKCANVPVRVLSITEAIYHGNYFQAGTDFLSFGALYLPYGICLSVFIDLVPLCVNLCSIRTVENPSTDLVVSSKQPINKKFGQINMPEISDPKIPANALKLLGIPEDKANDLDYIQKSYQDSVSKLKGKINKFAEGPDSMLQPYIKALEVALQTLTEQCNKSHSS